MGNKRTCGVIVPSSCVPWVGGELLSVNIKSLCDPVIEEVIVELDKVLKVLKDSLDVTKINSGCHSVPTSGQWYDVASFIYNEICTLKQQISLLQPQAINISTMALAVDMECMQSSCASVPVTLGQFAELIVHKICTMESRLNVIDPSNNTSGDTLFQPA